MRLSDYFLRMLPGVRSVLIFANVPRAAGGVERVTDFFILTNWNLFWRTVQLLFALRNVSRGMVPLPPNGRVVGVSGPSLVVQW